MSDIVIRRATEDDWSLVRDVRLAALKDAPYAFGSTYARERDYDEQRWRDWIGRTADDKGVVVLAFIDDVAVGMDGAFVDDYGRAYLVAMWVAPSARRRGIGAALTNSVADWAREHGLPVTVLGVAEGNAAAIALYESLGFRRTGQSEPLHSDPTRQVFEMVREN